MTHLLRQDVGVTSRQDNYNADCNDFRNFCKSENCHFFESLVALLILVSLTPAAFAAQRYTVKKPVSPPAPVLEEQKETPPAPFVINWETNYATALETAKSSNRRLLLYFEAKENLFQFSGTKSGEEEQSDANVSVSPPCAEFNKTSLNDWSVYSELLGRYVLLKVSTDAVKKSEDGTESRILSEPEFAEMLNLPGLAVIDFEDSDASYYGQVVAILPFMDGIAPTIEQTLAFLTLPAGTLTQRTLIYAVRTHPDRPLGAQGEPNPVTMGVAAKHSEYQAEKNVMGHQNYGSRSREALAVLGGGSPSEIAAQSCSGIGLFEGAVSCMRAWRHSSAHWNLARKPHACYGFDMRQGSNGAWFATGFFVD